MMISGSPEQLKKSKNYIDRNTDTELARKTLVLVLAGGEGKRLERLTQWRAKPAAPFGGKYRIIDFALSNCVNSGLHRIGVLTQYKAHSLIRHIQRAWSFMRVEVGEFVEIIPAQQRVRREWYRGTADAIYQNIDIIRRHAPEYVIILGGDHIYAMDYTRMLYQHIARRADMTVGCVEVPREEASSYGVMSADDDCKLIKFTEKPADPEPVPGKPDKALVSMGIYVFSTPHLYASLIEDADNDKSSHDFGKDVVPRSLSKCACYAYPYQNEDGRSAYWRDVGSIDSYWQANMELCGVQPELNLYDQSWPIWTYQPQSPPAKFIFDDEESRGEATDSLVAGGCIVSGRVKHSVIFFDCDIGRRSVVKDSVVLPKVKIGESCRISNAIIDKGCVVPDGTVIGEDTDEDRSKYRVTKKGTVLVVADMLGQSPYFVGDAHSR